MALMLKPVDSSGSFPAPVCADAGEEADVGEPTTEESRKGDMYAMGCEFGTAVTAEADDAPDDSDWPAASISRTVRPFLLPVENTRDKENP